jgi:hypothetical protein
MGNPLYARKPQQPTPPDKEERWVDPSSEHAFSVVVAAGWKAEGGLLRFENDLKYSVFTLTARDGAIVFWGDPNLPLRYVVPGPWNANMGLQPGKRAWFRQGDKSQELFPSPYLPADRLWWSLMVKRFGHCYPDVVNPAPSEVEFVRKSGVPFQRVDACVADFTSANQQHKGRVRLSTFGGDQPGDTWDANFITGFYGPAVSIAATEAAYNKALETYSVDKKWLSTHDDMGQVRKTSHDTAVKIQQGDLADSKREAVTREMLDNIRKAAVDAVRQRK